MNDSLFSGRQKSDNPLVSALAQAHSEALRSSLLHGLRSFHNINILIISIYLLNKISTTFIILKRMVLREFLTRQVRQPYVLLYVYYLIAYYS